MRKCLKCGNDIPKTVVIDGRRRNLNNRRFCFDCSPFGLHNTRNLADEKGNTKLVNKRFCVECGREYNSAHRKGAMCFGCYFNRRLKIRSDKVYGIVGEKCWLCGYDKGQIGRKVLCFHHMVPSEKCFELTARDMVGRDWETVWSEMKKCSLLCCRCHVEFHAGIIEAEEIERVYRKEWAGIDKGPVVQR